MSKSVPQQVDVVVLGGHPAGYLAAAMLRHKSKLRIVHSTIPDEPPHDRLVFVNPALFELHPALEPLRRRIDAVGIYGLRFLADDRPTASEYRSKSAMSCIAEFKAVRQAMEALAKSLEVQFMAPRQLQIHRLDEKGIDLTLGSTALRPKAMVVAGMLPPHQQRILGIPEEWERGIVHRYSYLRVRSGQLAELGARPLVPMSLDLRGMLSWAWLLPGERHAQVAVEQPLDTLSRVGQVELIRHWGDVLLRQGVLTSPLDIPAAGVETIDLPLAGALAQEGVANRTLLIGPAGGFYSACSEDVYPNCWSALHAAEVMKKALREPHLQDALNPYRQKWRTTLGDYLRGPQQNLRFLLPLVYRNPVMTSRLAEAILVGRSVVR